MAVMSARRGGATLQVAKTLLVKAEIFEHIDDHQTAKVILKRSNRLSRREIGARLYVSLN
jgi:LuxR family maltose regulon positive regulatory protein